MVKNLAELRSSVQKCIETDSSGHRMEATGQYLYAIRDLSEFLVNRYQQDEIFTREAENVIRLLSQCTERLGTVVEEAKLTQKTAEVKSAQTGRKLGLIDPMAKALAENSKLTIAHNYKVRSTNFTSSQIATMNLNLQRKMIENIEIAKQQKKLMEQRIEKRKGEISEELSKTSKIPQELRAIMIEVSSFEEEVHELKLYHKTFELKDDDDICVNYLRSIFEYGDHPLMVKLQDSRSKLLQKLTRLAEAFESTPESSDAHRMSEISDTFQHPWESSSWGIPTVDPSDSTSTGSGTNSAERSGESAAEQISTSASSGDPRNKDLSDFISTLHAEVHKFGNYMVTGSSLHEIVDKCPERQDDLEDFSSGFVQNFFFKCLYAPLLKIYRCKTAGDRLTFENGQVELNQRGMEELGLTEGNLNLARAKEAAGRVKSLLTMTYPADFTNSLVQFCRSVSLEIPKNSNAAANLVNADDLVSLLCLVFLLSNNVADLIPILGVMEIFISERKLLAEEGYCVVAAISALQYLISLSSGLK